MPWRRDRSTANRRPLVTISEVTPRSHTRDQPWGGTFAANSQATHSFSGDLRPAKAQTVGARVRAIIWGSDDGEWHCKFTDFMHFFYRMYWYSTHHCYYYYCSYYCYYYYHHHHVSGAASDPETYYSVKFQNIRRKKWTKPINSKFKLGFSSIYQLSKYTWRQRGHGKYLREQITVQHNPQHILEWRTSGSSLVTGSAGYLPTPVQLAKRRQLRQPLNRKLLDVGHFAQMC